MIDAAFQHFHTTRNVGDSACCPASYFDFGTTHVGDFGSDLPECRLGIFGGGQVFEQCVDAVIYQSQHARHRVLWSVGIDARAAKGMSFDIVTSACALVASRNWNVPGTTYLPCVSAMSPLFDTAPAPGRDVVLFAHATKSAGLARPDGIPEMSNHDVTMAEAIAFLASGETVVTNSYHGTYWAMLLGRKVLCLPFSNKFTGFRNAPAMADPAGWPEAIATARRHDGMLDEARALNRDFHDNVMNL